MADHCSPSSALCFRLCKMVKYTTSADIWEIASRQVLLSVSGCGRWLYDISGYVGDCCSPSSALCFRLWMTVLLNQQICGRLQLAKFCSLFQVVEHGRTTSVDMREMYKHELIGNITSNSITRIIAEK